LVDPALLEAMRPKLDSKLFSGPLIDPNVWDALRPKIDPKVFERMLLTFNAFGGMLGSLAFPAAFGMRSRISTERDCLISAGQAWCSSE
jgi:hypothetical protein